MRYVQKVSKDKHVVVQMDTTYWGCGFGLMAIKDALRKKVLWRKYVTHETIADYMEGVQWHKQGTQEETHRRILGQTLLTGSINDR